MSPNDPQTTSVSLSKSGQGVARENDAEKASNTFPKTDSRHWLTRVFKLTYNDNGITRESPHYSARIQARGRRERFPLGIANQRDAAKAARDIYLRVIAEGWDTVLQHYKPQSQPKDSEDVLTLGEYITAARAAAAVSPRALEGYCRSLRRIVAGTMGIKGDKKRFAPKEGGSKAWREKIDKTPLADLTPARVSTWGLAYVKQAGADPAAQARRRNSWNSILRQAKGLFSVELVERLAGTHRLPQPLPLHGVKPFKSGSMKYRSKIDAPALLRAAREQLGGDPSRVEEWKAFLLAFLGGLRKGEIDTLIWDQIDFQRRLIRIERTDQFAPKTESSAADVDMEPELVETLRGLRARATPATSKKTPAFFLESPLLPRPDARHSYYRCQRTFEALSEWLRSQGITARKAIHELRKEAGSILAEQSGLFAAQLFLRHGSPQTTALHYLDKKARLSTGLGKLLTEDLPPANVTPITSNPSRTDQPSPSSHNG
ncbi:MAG TPA: site-specific integrase [Verrucomicrobiales bacterium]|nr:site-specific integrase [Verrucomicrobiales bacterium]